MAPAVRAIQILKDALDRKLRKRTVLLNNGIEFEFWVYRMTMAEREKAQKDAKSNDATAFALQLLVNKALDENGQRLFTPGDISVLKHECDDSDLQALMLALLQQDDPDEAPIDMKSTRAAAKE